MDYLAGMLLGSVAGSMHDPLIWVVMVLALVLGLWRQNVWWGVGFALLVFAVRYGISVQNRALLGIPDNTWSSLSGLAGAILAMIAYWLGRFTSRRPATQHGRSE